MNIPLPNGTGDKGYVHAFNELVVPSIQKFGPDMIVLVLGQDSNAVSYSIFAVGNLYFDHFSILLPSLCRLEFMLWDKLKPDKILAHDFQETSLISFNSDVKTWTNAMEPNR